MTVRSTILDRVAAALVALALAVLGFGHVKAPQAPTDAMLAAYVQAGGSLGDLCLEDDDAPQAMAPDCPVCTLAKGMALVPEALQEGLVLRVAEPRLLRAGDLLAHHHTPRAPPARGPPNTLV